MKRFLIAVLCLTIIISSFATVLLSGASANADGSVFENPNNWKRYAFNTTHINSAQGTDVTWGSVNTNTNTAYTYNGDASSIVISAKLQLSTLEFETKPNTDYELSYRFLTTGDKYNSNNVPTYLVRTGIVLPDGCVTWGQDGYLLYIDTAKAYTAPNGVFANRTSIQDRTGNWVEEGVWQQVTLKFNSGDNAKLKLVVQAGTDAFYLDDFALTEKVDFENISNWGVYSATDKGVYTAHPVIDGTGIQKHDWVTITNDTANTAEGSGKSVRLNGNTTANAIMLNGLKTNTKYNLNFKYYIPAGSTWGSSSKAWFTPGIVKSGTALNGSAPSSYYFKGTAPTTDAGSWYDYTLTFTTDSTTDYAFTIYATFASGFSIYLDEMELNEAPRPTYFIQDFENYTKSGSEYVGALSVVTPEGTSVSGSKALQYDGTASGASISEGNNRIILNPANSNIPTLGDIVGKGNNFKVTFKYKLLDGEVKFYMHSATSGTNAWAHATTNPITYKSTTLSAGDTWQEFSYDFTLKADAADGTYSYPMFFIGGAGKAYIDYITVSTPNAIFPDVEIPSEVAPDPEGTMTFEASEVGDHLTYIEAIPDADKAPNYPEGGKWQMVSNNGYITYTDVNAASSKVANTYAETIYKADGTSATQTPHQGRKVGGWTFENNLTVSNAKANGGKKSLEVKSADMAYATGFNIQKAGKYTLTYYVNDITAIKAASGTFGSAVLSTLNIAVNRTGSDVYYTDSAMGATVTGQLPNHLSGGSHGAWANYTLSQFRSKTDLANVTPAAGETWYKVTHTFETKEDHKKVYFAIYNYTGANVYIDDIVLSEGSTPPVVRPTDSIVQDFEVYNKTNREYFGATSIVEVDGDNAFLYDGTPAGTNTTAAQNRLMLNPASDNHAKLSDFVAAGEKYTISMKYKLVSGNVDFYMNSALTGNDANNINTSYNPIGYKVSAFTAADGWNEVSFEYSVKADATAGIFDYPIMLISGVGKVYIDDIVIENSNSGTTPPPVDPPVNPPVDPPVIPSDATYDDAISWGLYHANGTATIDGTGTQTNGWISITDNTNKAYTYNGGEKSIRYYGNINFMATKLKDLEQGKAYKVSFKYFAPTTSTVGSSSKAWANLTGVFEGGTAMDGGVPASNVKKGSTLAGEADKWHEFSMLFRATSTDLYFGITPTFTAGFELYIDDFAVAETTEDPDVAPVIPGYEPKEEIVIDFDNYGGNAAVSPNDRIEIVSAEAYDGKPSKMLHFIKGQYESATTLNYNSTYAGDNDAVFTVGVKPKKVYNVSFRVKTNSQTLPEGAKAEWVGLYFTFGKQYLISSYQHSAKRDEWLYYEYSVSTTADQNLLSFYVNAGESTPDMWVDDIKITETNYEPFLGWGSEPRDEILINFDDFYVGYDIACASITDGPERDGKITKATYLKGGSYNYNAVANYSAVTQYRDPIFTVPCKENTLYEFSYYIYIPKDTGSLTYFAVYYDWANTWVLRASGMTERDEWVKKTTRFTTKPGQTQLSLTFNGGKVIPDIYLDDILLKEIKPGVMSYENDLSFCEDCFNILPDNGLAETITKSKTTVVKVPILAQQQYIFGVTVNSSKKSNSRIFLSLDGVNPMPQSLPTAPSAIISSDGKLGRYGINFVSDTSGYVYVVIENDDGALTFKDPYLFLANSLSTNLPMGRAEKPLASGLSVNINKGYLKKLFVFDDEEGGEQE